MESPKPFLSILLFLCALLLVNQAHAQDPPQQDTSSKILSQQYSAGVTALKAGNWTKALIAFQKVRAFDTDYRDVKSLMKAAKRGLERDSSFDLVARYYGKGVAAMKSGNLTEARKYFGKVRTLNPDYRDTENRLTEIKNLLQPKFNAIISADANLDSLYAQAMALIELQDWKNAAALLEKIQSKSPYFRDTKSLLSETKLKIKNKRSFFKENLFAGNFYYYLGGFSGVLFALPFLAIAFSPTLRARIYSLRGNHLKAAQIYEILLLRHPEKLQLYQQLADIYLATGQTDEKAIKVFKTVLQLHLANENHAQINSIVAQHYLTEGPANSEAIDVLEKALQDELGKNSDNHETENKEESSGK